MLPRQKPDGDLRRPATAFGSRPVALPRLPPSRPGAVQAPAPPSDPAAAKADACWQEFEAQDDAGRIVVYQQALDDPELLAGELAFEMLARIHEDAARRGTRPAFAECIDALRARRPELYEESAASYLSWRLLDDLVDGRQEELPALARDLAGQAGRDIDAVNRVLETLAYHGRQSLLLEIRRAAWPDVASSADILPHGIAEFANQGADMEIYDYVERTPACDPADAALLDRIKFFVPEPRLEYIAELISDLTDESAPAWTVEDLAMRPRQKRRHEWDETTRKKTRCRIRGLKLSRLINQFVGYLRRAEGIPFARGDLVRRELYHYFIRRHEGELNPRPRMLEAALEPNKKLPPAPRPGHPPCPGRVTFEVHLTRLLGFFNNLRHTAAALFETVPAWLRFLQSRRLIDVERRLKTIEDIRPLHSQLLRLWEDQLDDPSLHRAAQAWPTDAAQGPGEPTGTPK